MVNLNPNTRQSLNITPVFNGAIKVKILRKVLVKDQTHWLIISNAILPRDGIIP